MDEAGADARGARRRRSGDREREALRRRRHDRSSTMGADHARQDDARLRHRGNRWTTRRGPTPREHLGVTALGGKIYAVGGRTAGFDTNMATGRGLQPRTGRWSRLPRARPARRDRRGRHRTLDRVGRRRGAAGTIRTVYRYDVERRRWSRLPNLPTPRHGLGVAAVGGKVYVIGGGTSPGSRSARRTSLWRFDRQAGHDVAAAAGLVDEVDAVVLAVRAGDPEEEREPAPEAEPCPPCASGRSKRSVRPRPGSRASGLLGNAVQKTSYGSVTSGGGKRGPEDRSGMRHQAQCSPAARGHS